jgi:hypothetical protein
MCLEPTVPFFFALLELFLLFESSLVSPVSSLDWLLLDFLLPFDFDCALPELSFWLLLLPFCWLRVRFLVLGFTSSSSSS